jgi:hypothetical protein
MARTLASLKRTALPAEVKSIRSCLPSVMATPTRTSSSCRSMAMMPRERGREKSVSGVFLTVPALVAMKTKLPSS